MNPATPRAQRLHVRLVTLMLVLIGAFFVSLSLVIWFMGTERDQRDTDDKITRVGRELKGVLDAELGPMRTAIKMLAETSLVSGRTHRERTAQLGSMAAVLAQNPTAGSVYAGTASGSFVLMRNLKDRPKDRATFGAPEAATFLVQSVNRDSGAAVGRFDFHDRNLAPLSSVAKPDYQFDPRVRPWYQQAERESPPDGIVQTAPYIFASNQKVGITLATRTSDRSGVVGIDMSLTSLSRLVGSQKVSPSAEIVLFDGAGRVLAYRDSEKIFKKDTDGRTTVVTVPELAVPALAGVFAQWRGRSDGAAPDVALRVEVGGRAWYSRIQHIDGSGEQALFLGIAVPAAELMADSIRIRNTTAALSLVLLLLMLPVVVFTSKRISRPLFDLVKVAKAVERFDFTGADPAPSHIREVDDLALNMAKMKGTLKRFLDISSALSAESNFHRLINIILREMISVSGGISGALALVSRDGAALNTVAWQVAGVERDVENLPAAALAEGASAPLEVRAVVEGRRHSLHLVRNPAGQGVMNDMLLDALDASEAHVIVLPLRNRGNEVLGVLTLTLPAHGEGRGAPISPSLLAFIEALSGTAAIAIDNQKMLLDQKALLEGMIQLVAGAIDAKSPYSGGHCQRVPELSKMLARAACDKKDGPFAGFELSEEGWETLHIAGWLHDCGKVTTPEYVVDKATKLETIYDRIHEIRMRFEVIKRDAEISALRAAIDGLPPHAVDVEAMGRAIGQAHAVLDEEFAFVATCNIGGEFMAPEKIERLREIAGRQWLRTLDDRCGVSEQELLLKQGTPPRPLPAWEALLADKPEHITPRAERDGIAPDNPWGFRIAPPADLYNRGEIYNLSIARGTLSAEDRYKINEHIVQTIKMLSSLPFPKHLQRVTEIAGGHHEKLDGGGYPCNLSKAELSVEARIMAIADVFEALTAADRPYKKGKMLSEAIRIMGFMTKDRHIDPDLFALFLESGIHLEYARRFMRPEQIDEVDVAACLG